MKVLIVTSALTFVPRNYNRFILPMGSHPDVVGLAVIENRNIDYFLKGLFLILSFAAPRMGAQIIYNFLFPGERNRKNAFANKSYIKIQSPNEGSFIEFVKSNHIDLIINARTRSIYKTEILNSARLGCVNIHHGLLPNQRGLMCDFWAHLEGDRFGFSIHQMTEKIDSGDILRVVSTGDATLSLKSGRAAALNYLKNIERSCDEEYQACVSVIEEIKNQHKLIGVENVSNKAKYKKNPGLLDFYRSRIKGIKI